MEHSEDMQELHGKELVFDLQGVWNRCFFPLCAECILIRWKENRITCKTQTCVCGINQGALLGVAKLSFTLSVFTVLANGRKCGEFCWLCTGQNQSQHRGGDVWGVEGEFVTWGMETQQKCLKSLSASSALL